MSRSVYHYQILAAIPVGAVTQKLLYHYVILMIRFSDISFGLVFN